MAGPSEVLSRGALAAFLFASIALQYHVKGLPPAEIGQAMGRLQGHLAPDFSLPDLEGNQVSLASLRARGPVVVDFFQVDCMPCRMGWASLADIHSRKRDKPLTVVAVNLGDPRERLDRFLGKFPAPFPILLGSREVASAYGIEAIPRTVLVDTDGTVAFDFVGHQPNLSVFADAYMKGDLPRPDRRVSRAQAEATR